MSDTKDIEAMLDDYVYALATIDSHRATERSRASFHIEQRELWQRVVDRKERLLAAFAERDARIAELADETDALANMLEREHEEVERLRHLMANAYIFSVVPPIAELPEEDVTLWIKDNWSNDDIRAAIDRARKGEQSCTSKS